MKRLLIALLAALLFAGCSTKEKTDLREALVAKFKDDSDLKDYNLKPEDIADCVVGEITGNAPGFPGDPRRDKYFQAYVRFVNVRSSRDAEQSIADFQDVFGSAKKAREAATNITNFVMGCMGEAVEKSDVGRD